LVPRKNKVSPYDKRPTVGVGAGGLLGSWGAGPGPLVQEARREILKIMTANRLRKHIADAFALVAGIHRM